MALNRAEAWHSRLHLHFNPINGVKKKVSLCSNVIIIIIKVCFVVAWHTWSNVSSVPRAQLYFLSVVSSYLRFVLKKNAVLDYTREKKRKHRMFEYFSRHCKYYKVVGNARPSSFSESEPGRAVLKGAHLHCCPSRSCVSRLWSLWLVSCWSAAAQTASAAGRGY